MYVAQQDPGGEAHKHTLVLTRHTAFNFFIQFTFYCSLAIAVCIGTAGYCLALQQREGRSVDGRIVAMLALGGLFGFFTIGMTMTSLKYVFDNITNIDVLRKSQEFFLAVRVPLDSPPTQQYHTITYPLARPAGLTRGPNGQPLAPRDDLARRTFAVLRTDKGENPWDLGAWRNFKTVMGNNALEWLLPIRHSPCCNHDSPKGDYEFGPLIPELKKRYHLPELKDDDGSATSGNDIEMRERSHTRR